jgi:hypothetical protein
MPRTLEQRFRSRIAEYNTLHAVGLTAVRHPGDSIDNYRDAKEMQRRGVLTMRVTQLLRLSGTPSAIEQTLKSSGLSPEDGDPLLRLGRDEDGRRWRLRRRLHAGAVRRAVRRGRQVPRPSDDATRPIQ